MADRVREWIDSHTDWPILGDLDCEELAQCRTRGSEHHARTSSGASRWDGPDSRARFSTFWFDAPIEYIGGNQGVGRPRTGARDWRSWWFKRHRRALHAFLGKDNIPFHTINFPITIMGSGEPWKLVDYVKGFNYLTYYGGKFSTSQHRGVFMDAAIELLPADYWRYALLASAPESDDTEFTWESFALTVKQGPGRHLRQLRAAHAQAHREAFRMTVPEGGDPGPEETELAASLGRRPCNLCKPRWMRCAFRPAAFALRSL